MRPIDADALLKRWNDRLTHVVRDKDGGVPVDFLLAIHAVSIAPTLTLDELRPKGRWVEKKEPLGWSEVDVVECSICEENWVLGEYSFEDFAELHMFCPSCGADMRGGGEE